MQTSTLKCVNIFFVEHKWMYESIQEAVEKYCLMSITSELPFMLFGSRLLDIFDQQNTE